MSKKFTIYNKSLGMEGVVIIDDEDYERVISKKWHLQPNGYAYRAQKYKNSRKCYGIYMHRFIMNAEKGQSVDHINGNRLDNRKENLRFCTYSQNHMNRKKSEGRHSKYKGVTKNKNSWQAQIRKDSKSLYLGMFKTEEEAAKKYNEVAREMFGEFAKLNEFGE